jgi:hypothetical protein
MTGLVVFAATAAITLQPGGEAGRPGVQVVAEREGVDLQLVVVTLPADRGLRFAAGPDGLHELIVVVDGRSRTYSGWLSPDEQFIIFTNVDLRITQPGKWAVVCVAVSAAGDAPEGTTSVQFAVGYAVSPSSSIDVIAM